MELVSDFRFTQGSLQDYVECARRFHLRHARRLRWPAVDISPAMASEEHLQLGAAFHRLIHQHLRGVPVKELSATVTNPQLRRWWRNYLEAGPRDLPPDHYPEIALSAPVAGFQLVAQYDLVAIEEGARAVIVDWKTNRRRPSRARLLRRLQSRVYPYLLVRAGAELNGSDRIRSGQLSMLYWFANFPAMPEQYQYDEGHYQADHDFLMGLVTEIGERLDEAREELLPRADDERHCRYCGYRSLCRRGVAAGWLDELAHEFAVEHAAGGEFEFDFNFEQIAEADSG